MFENLRKYLDTLDAPHRELCVMRNHQILWQYSSDGEAGSYWVYSLTKITTAVLAMQMKEQGLLSLEEPVVTFLPGFGKMKVMEGNGLRDARTVMLVRHLLSMQGGLDYDLQSAGIQRAFQSHGSRTTMMDVARGIADMPLHFDPGCGFRYSLCMDVMGAVIMAAARRSLEAVLQEQLCVPLCVCGMTYHPTEEQKRNLRPQYQRKPDGSMEEISRELRYFPPYPYLEGGGGGLMADLASLSVLADALACNGETRSGTRILTPQSVHDMHVNRQTGRAWEDFSRIPHKRGYGYGLGVRTLVDTSASKSPVGEFGWDGNDGAYMLCDSVNRLSVVYLQHVSDDFLSWNTVHPGIRDLVYDALAL